MRFQLLLLLTCLIGHVKAAERLPLPPVEVPAPPGWMVEHVAFALGNSGKVVGGPSRWAISGGLPHATQPAEQLGELYLDKPGQRLYFSDQRRHIWLLEEGQAWPIAGHDSLGRTDGPADEASFVYEGVYGGHHDGMVATGHTVYVMDRGRLRRLQREDNEQWSVATVAGEGSGTLRSGEAGKLADLSMLGKGLTVDETGNLYFTLNGGLLQSDPSGEVKWVLTVDGARAELAKVYAKEFPDAKPRDFGLGVGESITLVCHNHEIYGLGRTWPNAWKVSGGRFVPLVGYAPADRMFATRWGLGPRSRYEVHCPMGTPSVWPGGQIIFQNEIPYATARYDAEQVTVLKKDGSWGVLPPDSKEFYQFQTGHPSFYSDGTVQCATPSPAPSGSIWVRLRKED